MRPESGPKPGVQQGVRPDAKSVSEKRSGTGKKPMADQGVCYE